MSMTESTRQAYTEIDNFIELLDDYNKNKVPKKLRDFFKKEKDNNYTKVIDANIPIQEQNLKDETLALIAMLNLQYWCEDEDEKQRLKMIYSNNEMKHQKKLREMYNQENIFQSKKEQSCETVQENVFVVEYKKENLFNKIKNFMKGIFNKNG